MINVTFSFVKSLGNELELELRFSQVLCAVVRLNDLPKSEYLCSKFPAFLICFAGVCHSKPALVSGGRIFVWPWIQKLQK